MVVSSVKKPKVIKTMDAFKKAYPKPKNEEFITLSPEGKVQFAIFLKMREQMSVAKKAMEEAKVKIALEIRFNAGADAGTHTIHLPEVESDKFDVERFKDDHEELYDEFITVTSTRKFDARVKAEAA